MRVHCSSVEWHKMVYDLMTRTGPIFYCVRDVKSAHRISLQIICCIACLSFGIEIQMKSLPGIFPRRAIHFPPMIFSQFSLNDMLGTCATASAASRFCAALESRIVAIIAFAVERYENCEAQ